MWFIGIQCLPSNTLPRNTFHGIKKMILDIKLFFRQIPRSVTKILKWNLSFILIDKYYFATFHENYACDRYFDNRTINGIIFFKLTMQQNFDINLVNNMYWRYLIKRNALWYEWSSNWIITWCIHTKPIELEVINNTC